MSNLRNLLPIENYADVVHNQLKAGDVLRFSNGQEFLYSHTLGEGVNILDRIAQTVIEERTAQTKPFWSRIRNRFIRD